MSRSRSIPCPFAEAACFDPECSVARCRAQEREKDAEFIRKTEQARLEIQRAKDREEAAVRALRELAAEQRKPMPSGENRAHHIAKLLSSDRQTERVQRHLNDIGAERARKIKPQPKTRRKKAQPIDIDLKW